jgi:hypothetical protein
VNPAGAADTRGGLKHDAVIPLIKRTELFKQPELTCPVLSELSAHHKIQPT